MGMQVYVPYSKYKHNFKLRFSNFVIFDLKMNFLKIVRKAQIVKTFQKFQPGDWTTSSSHCLY